MLLKLDLSESIIHSDVMDFISVPSAVSGMNLNKRELNEHVEFESQTYYAAFAAELEACAQPMWGLLTHCKVKVRLHSSHSNTFLFLKCSYLDHRFVYSRIVGVMQ